MLQALIAIIIALVGGLLYLRSRQQTAEALLQNQDTKKELNAIDKDIAKNEGIIESEEEKQKRTQKELEDEKAKKLSANELADFFNRGGK